MLLSCRYLSGGEANTSIVISENNFRFTQGSPTFESGDLEKNCGTHICVKSPPRPGMLVLKIGTLDDHSWFSPQSAIYCIDKQLIISFQAKCQVLSEYHHHLH